MNLLNNNIKPWKLIHGFFVFIKYYLYICVKNNIMKIDYSGRLSHYVDLDTKVLLPIYSETYHNINGEWVSIDDIDERNIHYRRFDLNKIKIFSELKDNRGFKHDHCVVELWDGTYYPIHGSIKEWEKQYEKWHDINGDIYHDLNIELSKIISTK